jgi:hypothetical protein
MLRDPETEAWLEIQSARKISISIEALLHWAFSPGREGGQTWKVDPMLSMDQGLTARPKRRPRGSWILAEACAGMKLKSVAPLHIQAVSDEDADTVARMVALLPARIAEKIRHHARSKTRPDFLDTYRRWGPTLNPRTGKVIIGWTNNRFKKAQVCWLKETVERSLTEASKKRWSDWSKALQTLQSRLDGRLARWDINLNLPPEEPWR